MTTPWRSRLARADRHIDEVEREISAFLATGPYGLISDTRLHPLVPLMINHAIRGQVLKPPPQDLGDAIGDVVENLRSCLDLIAYRLAEYNGTPPAATEFPVFWSSGKYSGRNTNGVPKTGSGLYKVRGMAPGAQAVMETLQPYQGIDPNDYEAAGVGVVPVSVSRRPLFLIQCLRQVNFHRQPLVTGAVVPGVTLGFGTVLDANLSVTQGTPVLKVGAFNSGDLLALIQLTVTGPNPIVEMSADPTFDVAFEPQGPGLGLPVIATLRSLHDHIEHVVFPQLEPFA